MNNFEETIDYWQKEWNKVGDISQVLDTHKLLANIETDNEVMTRYYNLDGKLIYYQTSSIENIRNYVVLTQKLMYDEAIPKITMPNKKTLERMRIIGRDCSLNEHGLIVTTDGDCSKIVKGSKEGISSEQWKPYFTSILKERKTIAYLVHSHPVEFTDKAKTGSAKPSDLDTYFYEDNIGVIIYNKTSKG